MARSSIELPGPEIALKLSELATVQRIAATHLTFSLTLVCPLRCAHCIVDAAPELGSTTMPVDVATGYAEQMPELAAHGITAVSFTGGEPTVARRPLRILADSAAAAGIDCGIVTAAPWARTPALARRTVGELASIGSWDVSVDRYHEDFVSLEMIRNAYEALLESGRRVTIRFSYSEPLTEDDQRILAFIATMPEAGFASQRVRAVGRGTELGIEIGTRYNPWVKPCITQGLVVRYDGSISPCCMNLVEERRHPFQLGQATDRPLVEIHREYRADPLLQLIRAIGFVEVMEWLHGEGLDARLPRVLPDEACEICELMMTDPMISSFLSSKVREPSMQLKIGVLALKTLGEPYMLGSVLERFADLADTIVGYDDTRRLYEDATSNGSNERCRE